MFKTLITIFLLGYILLPSSIEAQMILQLEKTGSVKKIRYYVGDVIEFQTKQFPEVWQKRLITAILPDQNIFKSDDDIFNVSMITHIRRDSRYNPIISVFLISGGVASILASTGFYLRGFRPDSWLLPIVIPAAAIIIGWLLRKYGKKKTIRIGPNRRLRTLDLNFYPFDAEP